MQTVLRVGWGVESEGGRGGVQLHLLEGRSPRMIFYGSTAAELSLRDEYEGIDPEVEALGSGRATVESTVSRSSFRFFPRTFRGYRYS